MYKLRLEQLLDQETNNLKTMHNLLLLQFLLK